MNIHIVELHDPIFGIPEEHILKTHVRLFENGCCYLSKVCLAETTDTFFLIFGPVFKSYRDIFANGMPVISGCEIKNRMGAAFEVRRDGMVQITSITKGEVHKFNPLDAMSKELFTQHLLDAMCAYRNELRHRS